MVEVKVERGEIVFRVLYLGRSEATKFANVRALHEALAGPATGELVVMHAGGDRVVGFHHRLPEGPRLFDMEVSFEILTIPGAARSLSNEALLVDLADAVIWLDDRDGGEDAGATTAYEGVLSRLAARGGSTEPVPILVQCYRDAPADRIALYERLGGAARSAGIRRVDGGRDGSLAVFRELRDGLIDTFRAYETELRTQGLEGHVKIRDRIYEKVGRARSGPRILEQGEPLASGPSQPRLVRRPEGLKPRIARRTRRALLLGALAAALLAALAAVVAGRL